MNSIIVSREKPKIKRISACSNGISIIYYLIGPQNGPPKKKFLESQVLSRNSKCYLRFLADSNRRTRFCRPLTKPLIQGTLLLSIFVSRLRLQRYDIFFNLQIFCYFFLTFSAFFSQPYFGLFCIDFMAQSELQHSHGLLLFFMRLKY